MEREAGWYWATYGADQYPVWFNGAHWMDVEDEMREPDQIGDRLMPKAMRTATDAELKALRELRDACGEAELQEAWIVLGNQGEDGYRELLRRIAGLAEAARKAGP